MLCFLAPEKAELQYLINHSTVNSQTPLALGMLYNLTYQNVTYLALQTAYGKVNIARILTRMEQGNTITALIQLGTAGTLIRECDMIHTVALSTAVFQYDVNFTALGYAPYLLPGMPSGLYPSGPELLELARRAAEYAGVRHELGVMASADRFLACDEIAARLRGCQRAIAVDAEAGAAAQWALLNVLPFVAVKGIADHAGACAPEEYERHHCQAAEMAQRVALQMILLSAG